MTTPAIPELERLFEVTVFLGRLEDHGVTRVGHRRVIPIVGGYIAGAVDAEILPGGADWQIVRQDGALEIDARYSARTTSGDLLYLQASGVRSGPPEVLAALLAGEPVSAEDYYFRTTVRVETASKKFAQLEHELLIASCVRDPDAVRYTTYRVT